MAKDIYGRSWDLRPEELCSVCGQPDNCGDCTHERLTDWLRVLKSDPKYAFQAAQLAQKAVNYLIEQAGENGIAREPVEEAA